MKRKWEAMYECSDCGSVWILILFRTPKSMPCLTRSLHCPFCMSNREPQKIARSA